MPICGIPPFPPLDPENNGRAYTGCVATAMAQIMRYHEHPNSYNYSIMPDIVSDTNYTSTGTNAIAQLMFDVALSLPSTPGCKATGAAEDNQDIVDAFIGQFGYSSTAYKASYNFETVKSEIRNGRPVILTAYRDKILWIPTKGHAWVADGYVDSFTCTDPYNSFDGYGIAMLHMNWGWGNNTSNGWYYSHTWTPPVNLNFQYKKEMVVGIQPQ